MVAPACRENRDGVSQVYPTWREWERVRSESNAAKATVNWGTLGLASRAVSRAKRPATVWTTTVTDKRMKTSRGNAVRIVGRNSSDAKSEHGLRVRAMRCFWMPGPEALMRSCPTVGSHPFERSTPGALARAV